MSVKTKLARALFKSRMRKKLTQEQAAEILDISCRYFQKLEAGQVSRPNIKLVCSIAKELDIDFGQLFDEQ